jgi:cytochrome P450
MTVQDTADSDPRAAQDDADAPPFVNTPAFKANAHAEYGRLRENGPLHRVRLPNGLVVWMVVSHELAREVFTHPLIVKDPSASLEALDAAGYTSHRAGVGLGGNMLTSDPPRHTRLRKLVSGAFTPRRVAALRPHVQRITDDLLDAAGQSASTSAASGSGEVDLVDTFTAPLPMTVISELLGVPEEDRRQLLGWSRQALGNPPGRQVEGATNLSKYLAALLAAKRDEPGEDLLSALVAAYDEVDGRLTEEELLGTAVLLVVAGHDTTSNLLGNAILALLRDPAQADLLRSDPGLVPAAVEEILRHDAPVDLSPMRYAAEDFVLAGTQIRRGDCLHISLVSVGRDGLQSADQQVLAAEADAGASVGSGDRDRDRSEVATSSGKHLSFGHGIHYCIGAPLARLEAEIAISTLLRRFPDLTLAVEADQVPWITGGIMNGPVALPVRLGSSRVD